jgi:hypothetical protein
MVSNEKINLCSFSSYLKKKAFRSPKFFRRKSEIFRLLVSARISMMNIKDCTNSCKTNVNCSKIRLKPKTLPIIFMLIKIISSLTTE